MVNEKYYTVREVAEYLRVHPVTVQTWIREGHLGAVRVSRNYRVPQSELDKHLLVVTPTGLQRKSQVK